MSLEVTILQPVTKELSLAVELFDNAKTIYVEGSHNEGDVVIVEISEEREESVVCKEVVKERFINNNPYDEED